MENTRYRILLIEDDKLDQKALERLVKDEKLPGFGLKVEMDEETVSALLCQSRICSPLPLRTIKNCRKPPPITDILHRNEPVWGYNYV
jgi:hypothetical protein